ncbi:hypothetical protein [Salinicola salarius]|uniref:hypothetical protein n=1 Tax=Salinicola salarius TaxID=430457 RepID=UPI000B404075|nr:hypothetical protein [Salinicola salarius]
MIVKGMGAALLLSLCSSVWAESARIIEIMSPDFTEVQNIATQEWLLIGKISGLTLPLEAHSMPNSSRELVFATGGNEYRIARSDVVLEDESLVTRTCGKLTLSMSSDARSASVKGAGESC